MTQRPKELSDAVELLKEFEKSDDYSRKENCFEEAMKIFEKYLSDPNISNNDKDWINNIKISYTRALLNQLPVPIEKGIWYLLLLIRFVSTEVKIITSQNTYLKEKYNELREYFKDDLKKLLLEVSKD